MREETFNLTYLQYFSDLTIFMEFPFQLFQVFDTGDFMKKVPQLHTCVH